MTETRQALLMAGVRLYGSMSERLLRGLTSGLVADEAGFHRQTFYTYWDTQAEYVRDLTEFLFSSDRAPVADETAEVLHSEPGPPGLEEVIEVLAKRDFERLMADPDVGMRIGLLMMGELDGEQIWEYHEETVSRLATDLDLLLAASNRRFRDGNTARGAARIVLGLVTGLVVEAKAVEDDPPAADVLASALRGLFEALTEELASP